MNDDINEDFFFQKDSSAGAFLKFSSLLKYVKFKNADKSIEEFIFN